MSSVSLGFDATVDRYWDTASLATDVAITLKHKGFCVVDPKLEVLRGKLLNEVEDLSTQFVHPPAEVVDGLLGVEGSALIYDVGTGLEPELADSRPGQGRSGFLRETPRTENISEGNNFLTTIAQIMKPVLYDMLGVDINARTSGVLHIAGEEPQDPPELTRDSCDEWMSTFLWHKLLIMLYMGPRRGTLEMQPFNEESNAYLAELDPGALVLLRPDVLTHKLDAEPSSVSLTMFLQSSQRVAAQWRGTGVSLIPVAARLDRWIGELILVHSTKAQMKDVEHTINAYRVKVRAISKFESPSPDSTVLGMIKQGEIVRGVEVDVGARQGLESDVWIKIKLNDGLSAEDQAAWIPTEGRASGLGQMVEKVPVETWRVFERRVFKLTQPDQSAAMLQMASQGELVFGYSRRIADGTVWLNTVIFNDDGSWQEAWMATTGESIGKGTMLEKVPNVPGELPLDLQIMQDHTVDKSRVRSAIRWCGYRGPGSYDAEDYVKSQFIGADFGIEVPVFRFDLSQAFEQDFDKIWWEEGEVKITCKHGAFIDGIDLFSAKTFNLSPAEASVMDPQQRFALELAHEGFIGAMGFTQKALLGNTYGVYVGGGQQEWAVVRPREEGLADMFITTGFAAAIQSNRTSFAFGFRGPSITYDCEASSSMCALECAHDSLNPLKSGNPMCIVQGLYCTLAPMAWPHLCRSRLMCSNSKDARCTVFDASACGYIKGEGVLAAIMNPMFETVEEQLVVDKSKPLWGAIAACATAHAGTATSLHAPHAISQVEIAKETLHRGQLNPLSVDYANCFGDGRILHDAVETMMKNKVYRKDLPKDFSLPFHLSCVKGSVGMTTCSCAIYEVVKTIMASRWGMMCGALHVRQLNPQIDIDDEPSSILTECLHTRMRSCFASTSTDSLGGTMGHAIIWGEVCPENLPEPKPLKRQLIEFWPGGGGELAEDAIPEDGYYIAGSWNNWKAQEMEEESDGTYVFTVTLGINCFEKFQIWLDGEASRALHPGQSWSGKVFKVCGPDKNADGMDWIIDGRPVQSEYPHSAGPLGIGKDWWKRDEAIHSALLDDEPDDEPEGEPLGKETSRKQIREMETMSASGLYRWKTPDNGKPGDEYKVRLQIRGKWRSLSWEKSTAKDLDTFMDSGTYSVAADWASWTFEEMTSTAFGAWELEVFISDNIGCFQIVRDRDWDQVFHPEWLLDQALDIMGSSTVIGPSSGMQPSFVLEGDAGDVFRIKFYRSYDQSIDRKSISWAKIRSMTPEELREANLQRAMVVQQRLQSQSDSKRTQGTEADAEMDCMILGSTADGEEGMWTSNKTDYMFFGMNQEGEE